MQQKTTVETCKPPLKDACSAPNRPEATSRSSTLDSESFYNTCFMGDLYPPGMKRIKRLSAGSKLSTYYYIGSELRVCADCNKKSTSRPVLRDIIDRRTGEPKVLKIISKSRLPPAPDGLANWRMLCEKLLNFKPSPNIMRVEQVWESESSFYIVTEKLVGGELFEFLLKEKVIPEDICKYIMKQIFQAVELLHSKSMLHRDIKPENIMFRNPTNSALPVSERYELVLIDFDTCKMTDAPNSENSEIVNGKRRLVGTYGYLAPEILRGDEYTTASDMWSIGIVLYILMTGVPPVSMDKMYDAKSSHAVLTAAETNGIDFNMPPLIEFPLARDLCRRLLSFDRHKRIASATDALAHPWLVGLTSIFDRKLKLKNYSVGDSQDKRQGPSDNNSGGYIRNLFKRDMPKECNRDNGTSGDKGSEARKVPLHRGSGDKEEHEERAKKRACKIGRMPQRQCRVSPRDAKFISPSTGVVRC
ncbi:Calcium-dependent protein kinase 4 [Babesia sp. Xinjiang]|uniref:Calcium-dependent protein kinase 4 n=1 Tax=Babesia sp. Xinjiang TaxID=462227 RepID=UPI000A265006|nr:Calcium-dependent protein kinase 4 [Babesia sp. Xinjiang]ORM40164.1 Calcium-dependent protein kinase 4 [Babesia sp. Xinjiang]